MSRAKEFDCDRALDAATRLFWEKGYEATSIQDLVDATGVNRASLYETFGGKRELFQKALQRFRFADEHNLELLTRDLAPGLARIREVFHRTGRQCLEDARGCLITNAVAELSVQDPEIAKAGREARERVEAFFRDRLGEAGQRGELGAGKNLDALARFLTNALFGLRMVAKMQPDRRFVDDVVATTLGAIAP